MGVPLRKFWIVGLKNRLFGSSPLASIIIAKQHAYSKKIIASHLCNVRGWFLDYIVGACCSVMGTSRNYTARISEAELYTLEKLYLKITLEESGGSGLASVTL